MFSDFDEKPSTSKLSSIQNFFTMNNPAVKKLLGWKQGDEDDRWAEKAIDSLVKKLKKRKGVIEDLELALSSQSENSKCITIPRSLDGRLQVNHRKGLPHVIYCRVWRWPDLQSHNELKALATCLFPFSSKQQDICINPYHYMRVESAVLPPVLVPRFSEFPPQQLLQMAQMNNHINQQNYNMSGMPQNICIPPSNPYPDSQPSSPTSFTSSGGIHSGQSSPYLPESPSTQYDNEIMGYDMGAASAAAYNLHNSHVHNAGGNGNYTSVSYSEPTYWSSVAYYELNCRVGAVFNCNSPQLVVDGFTNPTPGAGDRFCLGQLSNVNRNSTIENTRKHIGKGLGLYYDGEEVHLQCLSNCAIFMQSIMFNITHNFNANAVAKVHPGNSLKIFDIRDFRQILESSVSKGYKAVYDLTKLCTVRISFVKGWGSDYHRADATSTPCWIEIHLHGPLQWLDKTLSHMGSPMDNIGSRS